MANNQFYRRGYKPYENKNYTRINFGIKAPNVRVVQDGKQLGVFPIDAARRLAQDAGLDLVEIVPNGNPPVCSITDFDKYRYEQKQKEKDAKKNQKQIEIKEIRLRPCTQLHDIETKSNNVIRFLEDGKKVVVTVEYRKREISHKEEGFKIINALIEKIKDHATIEMMPRMEGNRLVCRLSPKKEAASS